MPDHSTKAIFLDLSGVLYDGDRVIPGALDCVSRLRKLGFTLRFVTNTATKSAGDIISKLQQMGFELSENELFTAPDAARAYLVAKKLRPFALVHEAIRPLFGDLPQDNPNCVVLGDARDALDYASLNRAFQICMDGAPLLAIGYNRYFKKEGELWLDSGPFIKALTWAVGCRPIVAGKPGRDFFQQVVASTPFEARECLMVGDDLDGDIIGAHEAGLRSCLVRTGKFREGDDQSLPEGAASIHSIKALPAYLEEAN